MILFLAIIFDNNCRCKLSFKNIIFTFFGWIQEKLVIFANFVHCPEWIANMLILGVYQTLTWIISVMLPPMAIFFPLFTFLEDLGYLPSNCF